MTTQKSNSGEKDISISRRNVIKGTAAIAAGATLTAGMVPKVHAAEDNTIRLALIGCGGRGSGAASNALGIAKGPVKLHAMADIFKDRLD